MFNKGISSLESEYPIFIANIDTINELTENYDKKHNQIYIDVENDEKVKEVAEHLRKSNENYQVEEIVDAESIKEALSFVSYIMILIFALATIMIFFVVGSLNKIIIAERMPVIGTFRSVGAALPETAEAMLLYADDMHAHNTFEEPECVVPVAVTVDLTKPVTVPKAAVLSIRF